MFCEPEELIEMEQDLINLDRDRVREICLETIREMVYEYEANKYELAQLKAGTRVLLPTSDEHAKMMLIIATNYLGIKPGDPITITAP
jgi:hypothetical protein